MRPLLRRLRCRITSPIGAKGWGGLFGISSATNDQTLLISLLSRSVSSLVYVLRRVPDIHHASFRFPSSLSEAGNRPSCPPTHPDRPTPRQSARRCHPPRTLPADEPLQPEVPNSISQLASSSRIPPPSFERMRGANHLVDAPPSTTASNNLIVLQRASPGTSQKGFAHSPSLLASPPVLWISQKRHSRRQNQKIKKRLQQKRNRFPSTNHWTDRNALRNVTSEDPSAPNLQV